MTFRLFSMIAIVLWYFSHNFANLEVFFEWVPMIHLFRFLILGFELITHFLSIHKLNITEIESYSAMSLFLANSTRQRRGLFVIGSTLCHA